jgi:hypothetical protein
MTGKGRLVSLAVLTALAACSSGGGGSPGPAASGGAAPGAPAAPPAAGSALGAPSSNIQAPAAVMNADGSTLAMANDQTSMTAVESGSNTQADPALLTVHVASSGIAYDQTFDLTAAEGPHPATGFFAGGGFIQGVQGADKIVFDDSLSFSDYGVWQHNVAADGTAQATGVFASGQDTPAGAMPTTGTATYTGGAVGLATNGTATFGLVGTSNVTADFGNRNVSGTLTLTAQDNTGNALGAWNTLAFSNAAIAPASNKFAGTIASTSNSALTPNAVSGNVQGAFFGPTANEVGGVFAVAGGTTRAVGAFGGHQ